MRLPECAQHKENALIMQLPQCCAATQRAAVSLSAGLVCCCQAQRFIEVLGGGVLYRVFGAQALGLIGARRRDSRLMP